MSLIQESAQEILTLAKAALASACPFWAYALGKVDSAAEEIESFCYTDGRVVRFGASELVLKTADSGGDVAETALCHVILHNMFLHPFKKGEMNSPLYDLACDITVDYYTDMLGLKMGDRKHTEFRKRLYKSIIDGFGGITESLCLKFLSDKSEDNIKTFTHAFKVCEHSFWRDKNGGSGCGGENDGGEEFSGEKQWIEISKVILPKLGKNERELKRKIEIITGGKKDYVKLIEKFIKSSEKKAYGDEFDYIYYCYGLQMYGNVPLIENIETSEVKDYSQVVVAIDVSGSTEGEPVKRFLKEVYSICEQISSRDLLRLRIIQCDSEIRSDEVVCGEEDFKAKMRDFKLEGGGGTDFRPVFNLLNSEKRRGVKIRALLYFTDGYGFFPTEIPDFKTCFLLFGENADEIKVPYFAYKILLENDAF